MVAVQVVTLFWFWYIIGITIPINWHAGLGVGLITVITKAVIHRLGHRVDECGVLINS
jgi:hypothetical protein